MVESFVNDIKYRSGVVQGLTTPYAHLFEHKILFSILSSVFSGRQFGFRGFTMWNGASEVGGLGKPLLVCSCPDPDSAARSPQNELITRPTLIKYKIPVTVA